jgi:hypothetical protein
LFELAVVSKELCKFGELAEFLEDAGFPEDAEFLPELAGLFSGSATSRKSLYSLWFLLLFPEYAEFSEGLRGS